MVTKHRVQDQVSEDRSEPEQRRDREEDGSDVSAMSGPRLDYVMAELCYTVPQAEPLRVRAFPPSSGRKLERPPRERCRMPVYDCRPIAAELTLDEAGFELRTHRSAFRGFFDEREVRAHYYPEVASLLERATGALRVFVFDHNVRSRPRSRRGEHGVREPVEGAHNDYTLDSGPHRVREILDKSGASHLEGHRAALINVWRPIVGPVQDHPLAVCDARSAELDDFMPTEIQHFGEGNLETPRHTGQIYSFRHRERHEWYYAPDMQPDEVLFLKCYDSAGDGRACFTGHTGFRNPACPEDFIPRESIEARTLAIFPGG